MKDMLPRIKHSEELTEKDAFKYLERRNTTGLMDMFQFVSKIK